MVEILKVVDKCCRDLSVVDIGESSLRASGEAEELRRWPDGARALGDAGGWLVVTLVPFSVWIDGEGLGTTQDAAFTSHPSALLVMGP